MLLVNRGLVTTLFGNTHCNFCSYMLVNGKLNPLRS